jgi:hypothetical protein
LVSAMPGSNVKKLFTSVIYKSAKQSIVFVLGRPLQNSLMVVGKARSLPKRKTT